MNRLIEVLGVPTARAIKVTGSNGKGSTCHMAAEILQQHGLRTGLYTSPHFFRFNERIQVDGSSISDSDFFRCLDRVEEAAHTIAPDAFGNFEILTAVAAMWFNEQSVDAIVWEAGIGGRLDATRVLPCAVATVVHVALEHTQLLGDTVTDIAVDKSRIADDSVPLVLGPLPQPVLDAVISDRASRGAPPPNTAQPLSLDMSVGMRGSHQRNNARCALQAAQEILGDSYSPTWGAQALAQAQWPGRFETLEHQGVTVHVDAAHNETGVACALETLYSIHSPTIRPVVLVGISHDRDYPTIVPTLTAAANHTVCTEARHKAAPCEALAAFASGPTHCTNSVAEGLSIAAQQAKSYQSPLLITGGLFLAAEALWVLRGNDPAGLRF